MSIKKGSLSQFILFSLEKTVDGYIRLDDFIHNSRSYALGNQRYLKKASLALALKRLRERGLINIEVNGMEVMVKLSELGKDFIPFKEEKWDGKWRLVCFDIPEKFKSVRNLFRRRLKYWEFRPWQRSIWVSKRNVTDKLNQLAKELKIEKWVVVIESESSILDNSLNDRST